MIYHVLHEAEWHKAQQQGFYEAASVASEGFMHCSRAEQVKAVLGRYYRGHKELLLLHIDEIKLTSPLKYELAPSVNEEFPHIFGRLNLDAVVSVEKIEAGAP